MSEYKELMILHYFNNVGASYSYQELLMIFGFQDEQLQLMLKKLMQKELLKIEGYFKVTEKGLNELRSLKLDEIKFDEVEIEDIFTNVPIDFSDIYIPKRFSKKFK
ncbi:hypothetical protein [Priestia megaterium]|uniref:hypothetical protein n=1 Tax=Priestia megaterium TaxID=1404 RepID=UPI000BFB9835|nr:hypothetical protein [Priestia megaterium]PGY54154.1 hypothetical protein COE35_03950 [Priestia megaterium]